MADSLIPPFVFTQEEIAQVKKQFDTEGPRNVTGQLGPRTWCSPQKSRYTEALIAQRRFAISLLSLKLEIEANRQSNIGSDSILEQVVVIKR